MQSVKHRLSCKHAPDLIVKPLTHIKIFTMWQWTLCNSIACPVIYILKSHGLCDDLWFKSMQYRLLSMTHSNQ